MSTREKIGRKLREIHREKLQELISPAAAKNPRRKNWTGNLEKLCFVFRTEN
jgi:hypothetical protein